MKPILSAAVVIVLLLPPGFANEPVYTLRDLDGAEHAVSDYHGKWVVVNYWTTRCVQCKREIPELIRFQAEHQGIDAIVWGVNFEQTDHTFLRAFVHRYGINYPVLGHRQTPDLLIDRVWTLPTTVLIDPYGNLVARHTGPVSAMHLESMMARYQTAEVDIKRRQCFS
jgi:peroxiredoxin